MQTAAFPPPRNFILTSACQDFSAAPASGFIELQDKSEAKCTPAREPFAFQAFPLLSFVRGNYVVLKEANLEKVKTQMPLEREESLHLFLRSC